MDEDKTLILQMWHQGKSKKEIQSFIYYKHREVKENRITQLEALHLVEQTIYDDYMKNVVGA